MPAEMSSVLTSQVQPPASIGRDRAPVFVLGCGRSGTKFLYHTLLSAGGFAVYYAESNAFNLLGSRFGNLRYRKNRQKMLDTWFTSKLFQRTGLTPEEIEPRVLNECHSAADFLRIVMETIAHKQGVHRWAECTPLHLLYLPLIKSLIPEALIVHIIRDGRDVAVSLNKIGWIRPYPWDRTRSLITAGIFWQWIVSKGLAYGRSMGQDYTEVHYERLVAQPQQTLARLGEFLQHDLDYDRIQQASLGSLQNPNSSFKDDRASTDFSPVGRWKTALSPEQVKDLETAIGDLLTKLDYSLETAPEKLSKTPAVQLMTLLYPTVFDVKLWLKNHTPLARTADIGRMGLLQPTESS
jgi:Sulfotransferase family